MMGCGYYRMALPFGELKRRGNTVDFVVQHEDRAILQCDVLVMQRQYDISLVPYIKRLQKAGKKVFYEIDDALLYIPPSSPNFKDLTKGGAALKGSTAIIQACDGIIVSTPDLADELRKYNANMHVCYNAVDDRQVARISPDPAALSGSPKRDGQIRIGWAGSNTHVDDLRLAVPALAKLMAEDERVRFVCIGHDVRGLLPHELRKRSEYAGTSHSTRTFHANTDWNNSQLPSIKYYDLIASADFDIAIAPIERSRFNASKSWLKVMEYCMLGIPAVASKHSPYRQWVEKEPGTVMLCNDDKREWYSKLKVLANEPETRAKRAQQGVLAVKNSHTISVGVGQWITALHSVGLTLAGDSAMIAA